MSNYVNKVKKDDTTYDMHDARLEVTIADAGKMVSVNEEGELVLVNAPSGGTKLYKHNVNKSGVGSILFINNVSAAYGSVGDVFNSLDSCESILICVQDTNSIKYRGILSVENISGFSHRISCVKFDSPNQVFARVSFDFGNIGDAAVTDTVTPL